MTRLTTLSVHVANTTFARDRRRSRLATALLLIGAAALLAPIAVALVRG